VICAPAQDGQRRSRALADCRPGDVRSIMVVNRRDNQRPCLDTRDAPPAEAATTCVMASYPRLK
jgi:hypothetical protein